MDLLAHVEHPWEQRGRCVYCARCGERLFQGKVPKDKAARRALALLMDQVVDEMFDQYRHEEDGEDFHDDYLPEGEGHDAR